MASLVTPSLSGASTATRRSINFATIQARSLYPRSIGIGTSSRSKGKVIRSAIGQGGGGGGVAKYKGTQMREKKLTEMIEEKVKEAKEVCEGDERSDECKVAWDEVEEISQAKAHLRLKLLHERDPLESYCQDNPETDECRIYED